MRLYWILPVSDFFQIIKNLLWISFYFWFTFIYRVVEKKEPLIVCKLCWTYWKKVWCHWSTWHSFIWWQLTDRTRCRSSILFDKKNIHLILIPNLMQKKIKILFKLTWPMPFTPYPELTKPCVHEIKSFNRWIKQKKNIGQMVDCKYTYIVVKRFCFRWMITLFSSFWCRTIKIPEHTDRIEINFGIN